MRERRNIFHNADSTMIIIYILLVLMGWLNIYAAVFDENHVSIFDLDTSYGKQALWIATSALLIIIIMMTDPRFYSGFSYLIYGGIVLLLIAVLGIGREVAGSKSWIEIGSFRLQPAELAKFATSLALAAYLGRTHVNISDLKTKIMVGVLLGIPPVLILLQNDTGSAMVYAAFIFVLFREGLSGGFLIAGFTAALLFVTSLLLNQWMVMGGMAVVLALVGWQWQRGKRPWLALTGIFLASSLFVLSVDYAFHKVLEPHQKTRINVLLGKETDLKGAGYNVHQSLIAIGSGGVAGKGYLRGTQTKYNYVPEQSTDFIFCTVGEEWGFAGSLVVLGLFLALLMRIISQAERQRTAFARIYGYCVASILFFHLSINVGMAIGLLPVIGIPLPFFSYGGSSLWSFTILLFIFIKLDSHRNEVV
ncbi:MAG: rod shape-determining protein RodA [Bacteroidales bacterium]|nr:rod shape-determining protein RodA [Bacteroidales bacterium]MDD3666033.1 rod shape-determining protein RodA [Bacteroidales bacterium]